ncbi:MAG TPA: protein kinase, partial [Pirellulales bacterium]|nr:protein kinase [Pirellulales bacterium]
MSAIVAACPKCRTSYRVDATRLGRQVACTKCKTQFVLAASQADAGTSGGRAESQSAVSGSSNAPAANGQTGAPRKDAAVRTIVEQPADHDTSVEQLIQGNEAAASPAGSAAAKSGANSVSKSAVKNAVKNAVKTAPAGGSVTPKSAPPKSNTASSGSAAGTSGGSQPPAGVTPPAPSAGAGSGDTKGRFEILAQLGEGAFGMVYKARDTKLDRLVALKVPKLGVLGSKRDVERFLREARSAGNLRHQHIVPIYDAGELGKSYFIASGFIEGNTLESLLLERPNPDLAATAALIQKLALALHYAHGKGIVHRDIKPGNVMIDIDGEPMIVDFGLARREEGDLLQTRMHAVMGTPAYMSPEQHTGVNDQVGPPSDQWALGIMLYEMLTGRRPFQGDNAAQLAYAVLKTEAERPSKLNPRISRDLETICLKCLEKDSAKRYASCRALADDLGRWLRD